MKKEITLKDLSKLADTRSKVYGFLSQIYLSAPNTGFIRKLRTAFDRSLDFFYQIGRPTDDLIKGVHNIRKFFEDSNGVEAETIHKKLSVEYTHLFRGIKRFSSPPPPYESIYRGEGLIMGNTTLIVKSIYDKAGLKIPEKFRGEIPDHIGFELDYMRYICKKEAIAWMEQKHEVSTLKELQFEFLNSHLIQWIPKFCDTAIIEAESLFYKGILQVTKSYVLSDFNSFDTYRELANNLFIG